MYYVCFHIYVMLVYICYSYYLKYKQMLHNFLLVCGVTCGRYLHHLYARGELNRVLPHFFGPNRTKDGPNLLSQLNTIVELFHARNRTVPCHRNGTIPFHLVLELNTP
jgi:hypothetical protein